MVIETMFENCEFPVLPLNDSPISEFIDILVRLVTKGSLLLHKTFKLAGDTRVALAKYFTVTV